MNKQFKCTPRDVAILQFINQAGFCNIAHIEQRFSLHAPRSYQVMKRLINALLVKHERIFHGKQGIYRLTHKGALYTDLPPLHRIPLATYRHDLLLIDLQFHLNKKYPDAAWISERQLRHDKYHDGIGKKGHIADALLTFDNENKKIAIELELSFKNRDRLEKILKAYGTQFDINEVWYYCPQAIASYLSMVAVKMPFVKIHILPEEQQWLVA